MVKAPKTRALTIRFSEEDANLLERLADERDVSAATIVREALRLYAETAAPKTKSKKK